MTTYKPKNENRKKLLVPIIVLALCATALIGAGYAALTSSTTASGTVDTDSIELTFKEGETTVSGGFSGVTDINLSTTKNQDDNSLIYGIAENQTVHQFQLVIDSSNSTTSKVTLGIEVTGELAEKFNLKVLVNGSDIVSEGYALEGGSTTFNVKIVLTGIVDDTDDPGNNIGFTVKATATPVE